MIRYTIYLLGVLLLLSCNSKKGADATGLLFGLLGGSADQAAAPVAATTTNGNTFTVVSLESTTANAAATTTATETSGTVTTSTETPVITTVETTTQIVTVPPSTNFNYENNVTTNITVTVNTPTGPVPGVPVTASEDTTDPANPNLLGSGVTNNSGTVTFPVTVPPTVTQVDIGAVGVNPTTNEPILINGSVPVQAPAQNNGGSSSTGTVTVAPSVTVNANNFQAPQGCLASVDRDCDGVADLFDAFPEDPTLGLQTFSGRSTISFESLFPSAGDADLNDFTMVYSTEMDRSPDGKVKKLRGIFTVVGRGAGSRHELRLSLTVPTDASWTQTYLNDNGSPWLLTDGTNRSACVTAPKYAELGFPGLARGNTADCLANGRITRAQMEKGLLIMPDSQLTSYNVWNTRPADIQRLGYRRGVTSQFEIVFDTPVDLTTIPNSTAGHFNWWIAFVRGGQTAPVWVVKRPGFETESKTCTIAGTTVTRTMDKYVDCNGFPFAIIVPGVFNFPIEGGDIRNSATTGYANFRIWAESLGTQERLWYNTITDPTKVVNLRQFYTQTSFSAYMMQAVRQNIWELSSGLILVGAALGFALKFRSKTNEV